MTGRETEINPVQEIQSIHRQSNGVNVKYGLLSFIQLFYATNKELVNGKF